MQIRTDELITHRHMNDMNHMMTVV